MKIDFKPSMEIQTNHLHSYHAAAVLNLFEEGKLSPHTVRKIKSIFIFTIGSLSENFKYLGTIDHFQKHVPQIFFKYTIKAVDGNAEDQFNLARCFEMGIGTPVSIADAIDWYKKSADIEAQLKKDSIVVEEVQLSADKAKEINALLNKVEKLNSISDLDDEKKKSLQIQIRTLGDQLIQHKGAKIQRIA